MKIITTILLSSFFLASCGSGGTDNTTVAPEPAELSNAQSLALGLDPDITDTDGDGISDAVEVGADPANPLDSDNDGIIDALEAGDAASNSSESEITLNVSDATANSLALTALSGSALKVMVSGGEIDPQGMLTSEAKLAGDASDPRDAEYEFPHGIFDLKVALNDTNTNSSVTLEYPPEVTIPDDAVLRIRKTDGSWATVEASNTASGTILIPLFNSDEVSQRNTNLQIADGGDFDLDPAPNKIRYLAGLGKRLVEPSVVSVTSKPTEVNEGDSGSVEGTFEVSLDSVASESLTITYQTIDGTAKASSDYTGISNGSVVIAKGDLTASIAVPILPDTTPESDEAFTLRLLTVSPSLNGVLSDTNNASELKLLDDDPDQDSDMVEDSLDNCPAIANTNQLDTDSDKSGDVCDSDDDNDSLSDAVEASIGTDPLKADTDGDNVNDPDDVFPLDPNRANPPVVSVSAINPSVVEGDAGSATASFEVTLDGTASQDLVITYQTVNGTASSPADYTEISSTTLTIAQGQLSSQIDVTVLADTLPEADEAFSLKLLSVTPNDKGVLSTTASNAAVTITDDDPDADSDSVEDTLDNCPSDANTDQLDTDSDKQGDACDTDDDNDGLTDAVEATKGTDPLKANTDGDAVDDLKDELPLDPTKVLTLKSAHRLLLQTTFGPLSADLDKVQAVGAESWVDEQLNMTAAHDDPNDDHRTHLERVIEIAKHAKPTKDWYEAGSDGLSIFNRQAADFAVDDYQMATWWENAIGLHPTNTKHGSDQLRQRVAFALSQLLVVSAFEGNLHRRGEGLANYYDMLVRHSFGNYRDLLGEMSRNPIMGVYLSHQGNQKANAATGTIPDENFARELMQLFTIGLYELNMDGSPDRDQNQFTYPDAGDAVTPTYNEVDVQELAKVMTGWDLANNNRYGRSSSTQGDYTVPMEFTPSEHEDELEAGGDGKITLFGESLDLNSGADGSGLDAALDILFNHPNMPPHVSKHLIMRLVTSNPSSEYVARVAQVFVDNGNGVRGDLKAVVRAILLDEDIRDASKIGDNDGKVKEPLIAYAQLLRALGAVPLDGWASNDAELTPVSGVYWFRFPERSMGQGALRSLSVFNFYTPDYVPSSSYFSERGLVSPEMKILTDQNVLGYSNQVYSALWPFVKNKIVYKDKSTVEAYAATRRFGNDVNILSDFDEPLAIIKAALGGDYENMESSSVAERPLKTAAVNALLDHYSRLLLGGEMPDTFRQALTTYLMSSTNTSYSDKEEVSMVMVKDTLRMITTSNLYMVQK